MGGLPSLICICICVRVKNFVLFLKNFVLQLSTNAFLVFDPSPKNPSYIPVVYDLVIFSFLEKR